MATRAAIQLALNGEISKDTNGKYPYPFVKWAGGKRFLLEDLCSNLPEEIRNPNTFNGDYYEPFVGGGALFFALHKKLKRAYLSDINRDLILTYIAIQDHPVDLILQLKEHSENNSKQYYLDIRKQEPEDLVEIAARFIYLNKTCYNGLYRVNRQGKFNVPYGTYKNPNIVDEKNILACHEALKFAKIEYKDFKTIEPRKGDFVYFDPPYHPTDAISFTEYTKMNFTEKDQEDLMNFARLLHKRGVKMMLSNSDTPYINDLYKRGQFHIQIVQAPRFVNCKADRRNLVREVLITNY